MPGGLAHHSRHGRHAGMRHHHARTRAVASPCVVRPACCPFTHRALHPGSRWPRASPAELPSALGPGWPMWRLALGFGGYSPRGAAATPLGPSPLPGPVHRSCRLRYCNQLRGDLVTSPFTQYEQAVIVLVGGWCCLGGPGEGRVDGGRRVDVCCDDGCRHAPCWLSCTPAASVVCPRLPPSSHPCCRRPSRRLARDSRGPGLPAPLPTSPCPTPRSAIAIASHHPPPLAPQSQQQQPNRWAAHARLLPGRRWGTTRPCPGLGGGS